MSQDLSSVATDPLDLVQPVCVLERAWFVRGNSTTARALIQWSGSTASSPTWEDEIDLRRRYPQAPAWGQAASEGGETVMTKKVHKRLLRLAQRQARRQANE